MTSIIVLPILVLPTTVVGMQNQVCLTKVMVSKEVVEEGDYAVFPFTYIHSLVPKVVDLFNIEYTIIHCQFPEILLNMVERSTCLPRYGLTTHSKNPIFPRSEEIIV